MRLIAFLLLALLVTISAASAQQKTIRTATNHLRPLTSEGAGNELLLALAKDLIFAGRLDEALAHLDQVKITPENEVDVAFLRGRIAETKGDLAGAVRYYRYIIGSYPELVRVRLELARVLFLIGEDGAAKHHFEMARGADPPPNVAKNIDDFLDAIRNRRRVRTNFEIALAPDTNVNAATNDTTVDIFGVPSQLTDDARQTSGIGLVVRAGADVRHPLGRGLDAEAGVAVRHFEYSNNEFDDTSGAVYGGVRRYLAASDIGVRANASRRWFGGSGYSYGVGGKLDFGHRLSPLWFSRLTFGGQYVTYDESDFLNGPVFVVQGELSNALTADSRVYYVAGLVRENADDEAYSNTSPYIGFGYDKEFTGRLRLDIQPSISIRRFDEELVAFGKRRRDEIARLRTRVTYRQDMFLGFAPYAGYMFTYNHSNISIYDYTRHQFELGITRVF